MVAPLQKYIMSALSTFNFKTQALKDNLLSYVLLLSMITILPFLRNIYKRAFQNQQYFAIFTT